MRAHGRAQLSSPHPPPALPRCPLWPRLPLPSLPLAFPNSPLLLFIPDLCLLPPSAHSAPILPPSPSFFPPSSLCPQPLSPGAPLLCCSQAQAPPQLHLPTAREPGHSRQPGPKPGWPGVAAGFQGEWLAPASPYSWVERSKQACNKYPVQAPYNELVAYGGPLTLIKFYPPARRRYFMTPGTGNAGFGPH